MQKAEIGELRRRMLNGAKEIFTIGHSTRSFDEFLMLLKLNKIRLLADIRTFPGSRRYPHFNQETMQKALPEQGIEYIHFKELGGRKKPRPGSKNSAWKNEAFRGYADHMETEQFRDAADRLQQLAALQPTAYMCSEAVWWSCHRALLSDYLKIRGWKVMHIMSETKTAEHPYSSAARIVGGELNYAQDELF